MKPVRWSLLLLALLEMGLPTVSTAAIATNAAADLVLGQTLFTTNASPSPATATSLNLPGGVAVDATSGKVFVADTGNNRVLRYPSTTALTSGAAPDLVLGQLNFSGSAANQGNGVTPSQTSLSAPGAVCVDAAGNLWIADTGNNRVLMFSNAANLTAVPANADRVFGQPDFTSSLAAPTASTMAAPAGLCVDPAGVLWVADAGSHRVLGYKAAATLANGPSADRVLGQTSFTANSAGTTQSKFFVPTGVAATASQLWVADSNNNRVLMFPNYPSINGAPAGLVLGQTTYISSTPATSAAGLTLPTAVAVSGTTVWVADSANNRVLNYAITSATGPGADATTVIGQATFLSGTSGLSAQKLSLYLANQISIDASGALWVADQLNNRVLRFASAVTPPTTPTTVKISGPAALVTSKSTYTIKGTAAGSLGISRVSYQIGAGGYYRASGTTSWSAKITLKNGSNRVQVIAVDKNGKLSPAAYVKITRATGPAVAVSGAQSITTTASSITIKGTAAAPAGVARVSYQVGTAGYLHAKGTKSWSATITLKKGKSRIEFRSVDKNGDVSDPVYVNVTRS